MAKQGLTPKQRLFVREFLVDRNATQAAKRAGYSEEWANKLGPRMVGKSRFKRAIREAEEARASKLELDSFQVIRELALLAFSNLLDYQINRENGLVELRSAAMFGAERALSSVRYKVKVRTNPRTQETETEFDTEFKLWDKPKSLAMLGQHLGMLKPADMPALEQVLASLPGHIAESLRKLIAQKLPDAGSGS